jgi:hypothetical protein
MEVMLDPTSQTIHYSSAGRAGVLAQLLAPDPQLAVSIGAWADRLVSTIVLERLLQLARAPYPALFSSSLTDHDLACCQAACTNLVVLFEQGRRWIANQPLDRRRVMVQEHLNNAYTALILLFEGTHDRQRRLAVAGLLIELANLKRRM